MPQGKKLSACKDISLQVHAGQTLGIVGESGSGKSTLVKMLMLMEEPTAGEIFYQGKSILGLKKKEIHQLRPHIQMVFQAPQASLNPKMKIGNIVTEPLLNYRRIKRNQCREKARELLEMVDLDAEYIDRYPHTLSGGQCQRVSIARALALNPEILICDEATSALDVSVQKTIVELLKRLQKKFGTAIIFISHDLALVHEFAHEILVMEQGCIVNTLSKDKKIQDSQLDYTKNLLDGIFSLKEIRENLKSAASE